MRVGIDARLASYEIRGMGRYVLHLVSGLVADDENDEYIIYGDPLKFPSLTDCANVKSEMLGRHPTPFGSR